jgi:hypothetical protein
MGADIRNHQMTTEQLIISRLDRIESLLLELSGVQRPAPENLDAIRYRMMAREDLAKATTKKQRRKQ